MPRSTKTCSNLAPQNRHPPAVEAVTSSPTSVDSSAFKDPFSVPAQCFAQATGADGRGEIVDALEAGPFKLFQGQTVPTIVIRELLGTETSIPCRFELGQEPANLSEIHPVTPFVRSRTGCILDPAGRRNFFDNAGEFPDAVVLAIDTNVECLVVHQFARCIQRSDEGP